MNKGKKNKILSEILNVCAENTTAYKIRKTMKEIEYIIEND